MARLIVGFIIGFMTACAVIGALVIYREDGGKK